MSALHQTHGKLFCESLESAVVSGNAASSEKGDAHLHPRGFGGFACGFSRRGPGHFLRRVLGDRRVFEPTRHVFVIHPAPGLNQAALGEYAWKIPREEPERSE